MSLADYILVLQADGSMAQSGSYEELKNQEDRIEHYLQSSKRTERQRQDPSSTTGGVAKSPATEEIPPPHLEAQNMKDSSLAIYLYYFNAVGLLNLSIFVGLAIFTVFANSFSRTYVTPCVIIELIGIEVWLQWLVNHRVGSLSQSLSIYAVLGVIQLFCQGSYYWQVSTQTIWKVVLT